MSINCMSNGLIPKALSISSMNNMFGLLGCSRLLPMSAAVLLLVISSVDLLAAVGLAWGNGQGIGVSRLCWHNFEHNRHIFWVRIMLAY